MSFRIAGILLPVRYKLPKGALLPPGIFLPMYSSPHESVGLAPIIQWDTIVEVIAMPDESNIAFPAEVLLEGASVACIGQEAQYTFVDPKRRKPYTATRSILVPVVENWLRSKDAQDDEQLYTQAKVFSDGHLTKMLQSHIEELMRTYQYLRGMRR